MITNSKEKKKQWQLKIVIISLQQRSRGLPMILSDGPCHSEERRDAHGGKWNRAFLRKGSWASLATAPTHGPNVKADPRGKALISKISKSPESSRLPPRHLVLLEPSRGTAERERPTGEGGAHLTPS